MQILVLVLCVALVTKLGLGGAISATAKELRFKSSLSSLISTEIESYLDILNLVQVLIGSHVKLSTGKDLLIKWINHRQHVLIYNKQTPLLSSKGPFPSNSHTQATRLLSRRVDMQATTIGSGLVLSNQNYVAH